MSDGSKGFNKITFSQFNEMLRNNTRAAFNIFPMRTYMGMMAVELVESTEDKEGGWKTWIVTVGSNDRSSEVFFPFSRWEDFELEILRRLHPTFICSCKSTQECFSENCPVKPQ